MRQAIAADLLWAIAHKERSVALGVLALGCNMGWDETFNLNAVRPLDSIDRHEPHCVAVMCSAAGDIRPDALAFVARISRPVRVGHARSVFFFKPHPGGFADGGVAAV